jgi:hypothetical protein
MTKNNTFDVKKCSKLSIISYISSVIGVVAFYLTRLDLIVFAKTLTLYNVLMIVSITGYFLGIVLGIMALFQIKKNEDVLKGKLNVFFGILLGVLGLSFTLFGTYVFYKLRHM